MFYFILTIKVFKIYFINLILSPLEKIYVTYIPI